jgi:hypothetical protein
MKKNYFFAAIFGLFLTSSFAQFTKNDVQYWIGSGVDSAVVVIDFNDNTTTPSLAWGFLFESGANVTVNNILETLTFASNVSVASSGGFLNDIVYGVHSGIGGTNNYYWGTYTGASMNDFMLNGGVNDVLIDGNWYGFNFTDWNPNPPYDAMQDISNPVAVQNPNANVHEITTDFFYSNKIDNQLIIKNLEGNLTILDLSGKVLFETKHHNYSLIDCSSFSNGLYIVSIRTKNGLVTKKVQF